MVNHLEVPIGEVSSGVGSQSFKVTHQGKKGNTMDEMILAYIPPVIVPKRRTKG